MTADAVRVEHLDERTAAVVVQDDPLGDAARELGDCVRSLLAGGTPSVVVEFGGGILNSKLLDALVRATAQLPDTAVGVAVVVPVGYIRQMLTVSEAGGLLLLAENREEALEALRET